MLDLLECSLKNNKLFLRIPTFDFIDNESGVMEFLAAVPQIPVQQQEVSYHSCGAYPGSCDCPIFDYTEKWVNEKYDVFFVTSIEDIKGYNFVLLGEVEDFINKTDSLIEVYHFNSHKGSGLCFKVSKVELMIAFL